MAFVNLPPNLQDMFGALSDRIAKLETGPNQPLYVAEAAQGSAASASAQATSAQALATAAYIDANAAQTAAATAYAKASTAIQVSANTIVNASNQMTGINGNGITVYSGASSTSGARVLLNSLGLLAYNSSNTATFTMSSSDGSISMLGNLTTGSNIDGATITGGVVQTSTGNDAVVLNGAQNALGIKSGGAYAGWVTSAGSGQVIMHYGSSPSSLSYPRTAMSSSAATLSGSASSGFSANNNGTNGITGATTVTGALTVTGSISAGSSTKTFDFLSGSGVLRVPTTYTNAISTRAVYINSAGDFGTVSSSERFKHDIADYVIDKDAFLGLELKTFHFNADKNDEGIRQYGFIAEDADRLGLFELAGYDEEGLPDYFAYEKLGIFLHQIVKQQEARIADLEARLNKLENPTT